MHLNEQFPITLITMVTLAILVPPRRQWHCQRATVLVDAVQVMGTPCCREKHLRKLEAGTEDV